jgi:hypothetical protein
MKFRTSKCCGDRNSVNSPHLRRVEYRPSDHEVRQKLPQPVRAICSDTNHPAIDSNDISDGCPQAQLEGRVLLCFLREHCEDCRLRNEATNETQRRGREPRAPAAILVQFDGVDDRAW